jgi:glycerol-3-phosphate dehydrogenase
MVRDLRQLADTRFDVLVVGAGIYGAITAWDAASRGLSVALVDRADFGGGTSFNNLKTLHGGLRSLQSLDVAQARRFIRERRALARVAPHLVRRLPFVIATTRHPKRSRLLMRLALAVSDAVAHDRNEGLGDPTLHLPAGEIVTREEALTLNPVVSPAGITGGAVWYDYQMTNADRMTLSFVQSAAQAGAVVANYIAGTRFLFDGPRVVGMQLADGLSDHRIDVRARVVVNATGAWAPSLGGGLPGASGAVPAPRLSRAMNLVVKPVVTSHACGGLVDGRFLFLVPWRHVSMLGTSHDAYDGPPDRLAVTRWDLEAFLKDSRDAFPHANLRAAGLVHRGLLPMLAGTGTSVRLLRESRVVNHAAYGAPGLVSIHGVRYTTARLTAEEAVDQVFRAMGVQSPPACRTAETPLAGAPSSGDALQLEVLARDLPGVPAELRTHLASTYGTGYNRVLEIAREIPVLGEPLGRDCQVVGAEILHAVRREMALKLSDAVIRRTEAGSAGHPGSDALDRAATIMAHTLGWDDWRKQEEIGEVEAFYQLPT